MLLSYPKVQPPIIGTVLGSMWVGLMVLRKVEAGHRANPELWYKLVPVKHTTHAQRVKWAKEQMDNEPRCERIELLHVGASVDQITQVLP